MIVMYSRPASWLRYNCMPAKSSTDKVVDSKKETVLDTAATETFDVTHYQQLIDRPGLRF